jgi:putative tricarboxylic transport membrane protein
MGTLKHPGPGFLPFGLACILIALALALLISRRNKGRDSVPFWPGQAWLRPLLGTGAFVLYAFLINYIGFLLTTFIFLVLWMWVIEKINWFRIMAVSVAVTAVLYLIFGYLLEVPLPGGFLA